MEKFENANMKITLNIAKMKSMQPKLKKIDELLFSQAIISAQLKEGCGAQAILRQMELAKRIGPDPSTGKSTHLLLQMVDVIHSFVKGSPEG